MECGYRNHERFPALEAAWPSLAPALALFLVGDNERLQTLCDALRQFLHFQGRWDERLALCGKAETRAVAANDYASAGWRTYNCGMIYYRRRQANEVLTCAERAAAHWARAGTSECSRAVQLRGHFHRLQEDYPAAITSYLKALEIDRKFASESVDVAIDLNALAGAERVSGDLAAAEIHSSEALKVASAVSDDESVAVSAGILTVLALDRKDWLTAETRARVALPLSEALHRQELIAKNNRRLAEALVRQGKASEALPHAKRAMEIYSRLGTPELANAQATLRECEEALA